MHPLLDTLGIAITTRAVAFQAGNTLAVEMAVPSAQTVLEMSCAPQRGGARGPSALVGKVLDADTDTPLVGAKVSLSWVGAEPNDAEKGAASSARSPSDPMAAIEICGLPPGMDGNVQAEFNGQKTAEVRVVMDEANPLGFQSLRIGTTTVAVSPVDTTPRKPGVAAPADTAPEAAPRSCPVDRAR